MFKDLKFCKDCIFISSNEEVFFCEHTQALVQNHEVVNLVTGELTVSRMTAERMRKDRCGYDGVLYQNDVR